MPMTLRRFSSLLALTAAAACAAPEGPRVSVVAPPDTADTAGPYEVVAIVTDDGSVARAEVEWFREGVTAAPAPLAMTAEGDRYRARIPGQPVGSVVKFTVRATDDEGLTTTAQKSTPDGDAPFSFRVLGPGN